MGIRSVRDTVRWHLGEPTPGTFDFSSEDPPSRGQYTNDHTVRWAAAIAS